MPLVTSLISFEDFPHTKLGHSRTLSVSVVEESEICMNQSDLMVIACTSDILIIVGARRTRYVPNSRATSPVYVVPEGEECVRTEGYSVQFCEPFLPFFLRHK